MMNAVLLCCFCASMYTVYKLKRGVYEKGLSLLTHPCHLGYKGEVGYIHTKTGHGRGLDRNGREGCEKGNKKKSGKVSTYLDNL